MHKIWNRVNNMKLSSYDKSRFFVFIITALSCFCGALIWVTVGRLILPEMRWLFCFAGYPAVFVGVFGGSLYLFNHEF